MEQRNLDFGIEMTPEQWEQLGLGAARLGPEEGGFSWAEEGEREDRPIRVYLRDEDAPNFWRHRISREEYYGTPDREIARFRFNDGRPYAELVTPSSVDEPAYDMVEEHAMQDELENWTRNKWHELMREAGLHYERGHIPQG